jgi:hypothetical protein
MTTSTVQFGRLAEEMARFGVYIDIEVLGPSSGVLDTLELTLSIWASTEHRNAIPLDIESIQFSPATVCISACLVRPTENRLIFLFGAATSLLGASPVSRPHLLGVSGGLG